MLINKLVEKYPNSKLIKVLANKKIRSLIYLSFWFIFILVVYIVYLKPIEEYNKSHPNLNNNEQIIDNEPQNEEKTFADMQNELLKENFAFTFTKNTPEGKVVYKGESLYDEKIGYKESNEEIIKYYIKNDTYYIVSLDDLILTNKEELYEEYFDIANIFSLISNAELAINDNIYNFQIDNIYVKITLGIDNISQIEITEGNDNYLLEFRNVNSIEEINY